ncbi:MAG: hypothetical protein QOJ94_1134 [Sphingomonadales bacterium]|jgi:hypothetical protein|nr:hypothetical protein [Sphingomonadales bacterium]
MARSWSLVPIGLAAASLQGCQFFSCGDDATQRAVSPDGQRVAVSFVRNCGATTDFSTHVTLANAGEKADDSDAIFVAQAGSAPRTPQGGPRAQLRWLGPSHLLVSYDFGANVAFQAIRARDVTIDYAVAGAPAKAQAGASVR